MGAGPLRPNTPIRVHAQGCAEPLMGARAGWCFLVGDERAALPLGWPLVGAAFRGTAGLPATANERRELLGERQPVRWVTSKEANLRRHQWGALVCKRVHRQAARGLNASHHVDSEDRQGLPQVTPDMSEAGGLS